MGLCLGWAQPWRERGRWSSLPFVGMLMLHGSAGWWEEPRTSRVLVTPSAGCIYDRIKVSWTLNLEELSAKHPDWQPPLFLDLVRKATPHGSAVEFDTGVVTSFNLLEESGGQGGIGNTSELTYTVSALPGSKCTYLSPLECRFNHPFCRPRTSSVELKNETRSATITLSTNTTQPNFDDLRSFLQAFAPWPGASVEDVMAELQAERAEMEVETDDSWTSGDPEPGTPNIAVFNATWLDARTLDVHLPEKLWTKLYDIGVSGVLPLEVRANDCANTVVSGSFRFRVSAPGYFRLSLSYADPTNGTLIPINHHMFRSPLFEAHYCGPETLVQVARVKEQQRGGLEDGRASGERRRGVGATSRVPEPVLRSPGVLALSSHALKLAHQTLPKQEAGSWSIGMWVNLLEKPTGDYRTLFYKGEGEMRTPSAWFLPHESRLTLRASVEGSPDLGSDSSVPLEVGKWTQLIFIFANDSASIRESAEGDDSVMFAMTLMTNGEHDVTVKYKTRALPNNASLSIGKDPSHPGPRALLSRLTVWDPALTREQARLEYERSAPAFDVATSKNPSVASIHVALSILGFYDVLTNGVPAMEEAGHQGQELLVDPARIMFECGVKAVEACRPIEERFDHFDSAARRGHSRASFFVAMLHLYGTEEFSFDYKPLPHDCPPSPHASALKPNTAKAMEYLLMASMPSLSGPTTDQAVAWRTLAFMLLSGVGVGPLLRDAESTSSANLIATPGSNPTYKVDTGNAAFDSVWLGGLRGGGGGGVVSATRLAIGLLHLAALYEDPQAQLALALRYKQAQGVGPADLIATSHYMTMAAEVAATNFHAAGQQPLHEMQKLSEATIDTVGVGQRGEDDAKLQYTMLRAEEGDVPAMITLGDLFYWGGRGIPRDHDRALALFDRAAAQGDNNAKCLAAGMYLKGEGTERNHTRAVELYEEAAKAKNVRALNGLGFAYFVGDAVEKNLTKAFEYFLQAAEMETDGDSLYNAGHCLERGLGTPVNLTRAASFYQRAADLFGHFDSVNLLGLMYGEGRGVPQDFSQAIRYLGPASGQGHWGRLVRAAFDRYLQGDLVGSYVMYAQAAELGYDVATTNAAFLLSSAANVALDPLAIIGSNSDHTASSAAVAEASSQREGVCDSREEGRMAKGQENPEDVRHRLALRLHWMAEGRENSNDALVPLGDAYYEGLGGVPQDYEIAMWFYSRACWAGLARGCYSEGWMYEAGLGCRRDLDRAVAYYHNVLQLDKSDAIKAVVYAAMARVSMRRWLGRLGLGHLLKMYDSSELKYADKDGQSGMSWLEQVGSRVDVESLLIALLCAVFIGVMLVRRLLRRGTRGITTSSPGAARAPSPGEAPPSTSSDDQRAVSRPVCPES